MNVLFIGLGSAGKKHANIISQYYPHVDIYAYSENSKHNIPYITTINKWSDIDRIRPEVAFICNPTYKHVETAISCAKKNMHIFLEKPIGVDLDGIDELCNILVKKNLTCYIAYPFRFHSHIRSFKTIAKNIEGCVIRCYTNIDCWGKQSYSFERDKGGGVLYELSHEIYLAQYLFGPIVKLDGDIIDHFKYNISGSSCIDVEFTNGKTCKVFLSIDSHTEARRDDTRRIVYFEKGETHTLNYKPTDQMYEYQMDYFLRNYKNPNLKNNIWEMLPTFKEIVRLEKGQ